MPRYDLHCTDCHGDFSVQASMADKAEKHIACPACGSLQMETIFKPVNFHIKRNDPPACPNSHICGAGCRHAQ